jgi:hypothetical protein
LNDPGSKPKFYYDYYGYWCFYSINLALYGSFIFRISGHRGAGKPNAEADVEKTGETGPIVKRPTFAYRIREYFR